MGKAVIRGKAKAAQNEKDGLAVETVRLDIYPYVEPSGDLSMDPGQLKRAKEADDARRIEIIRAVLDDIRAYRHVCRHMAAVRCVVDALSADLVRKTVKPKPAPKAAPAPEPDPDLEQKPEQEPASVPEPEPKTYMALTADMEKVLQNRQALLTDLEHKSFDYAFADNLLKQTGKPWMSNQARYAEAVVRDWWAHPNQFWSSVGVKAMNGWALLNANAYPPQFKRVPLSFEPDQIKLEPFGVTLTWLKDQPVKFKFRTKRVKKDANAKKKGGNKDFATKIDGYVWSRITGMLNGELNLRKAFLHENDGEFYIRFVYAYQKPIDKELQLNKSMEVAFQTDNPEEFFFLSIRKESQEVQAGKKPLDLLRSQKFGVLAAVSQVDRLRVLEEKFKAEQATCGSRSALNRGEGYRKAFDTVAVRRNRVATGRRNSCRTWNHVWTKRVIETARQWKCGKIQVFNLPSGKLTNGKGETIPGAGLCGRSWEWAEFSTILKNKAVKYGIVVENVKGATQEELVSAVSSKGGKEEKD